MPTPDRRISIVQIASLLTIAATQALLLTFFAVTQAGGAVATKKSIAAWVSCTGTLDDLAGATKAFAAARNGAFTLVVDCPVRLESAAAIDRVIFIDNGTSVEFTGAGKFLIDNLLHPAFVIANSNNVSLLNWNVEWDGSIPVNPYTGGYTLGGKPVYATSLTPPAGAFNDIVLTNWLQANRSITFDQSKGYVKANWVGPADTAAVFYITGDCSNLVFTGMKVYVPPAAGGNQFIPTVFAMSTNWKSGQVVNAATPHTAQQWAVPHGLTFSGIALDGTLMGWQGNVQNALFQNITSGRYSDLQDAKGGNVGGVGKWFPPPHLMYLNYDTTGDPALFNSNLLITGVIDAGPRIGVARDKGGTDSISGYALSLKLGCNNCTVNGYGSTRPDGFMDVLPSYGLSVSNVFAEFDSAFLNNIYTAGVRFPSTGYHFVTFTNVDMVDIAASTITAPIGNSLSSTNESITLTDVEMNRWAGAGLPVPTIAGLTNNVALGLAMTGQTAQASYRLKRTVSATISGNPATLHPGASTVLNWSSAAATSCAATGAWSGTVGTSGSRTVKVPAAGNYDFILTCQNASYSASTTLHVVAQ
jgi:hypothetical protein